MDLRLCLRKISKVAVQLQHELKRRPTLEEIAKKAGCTIDKVMEAFESSGVAVSSMDKEIEYDEGESSRYDTVADLQAKNPANVAMARDEARELRKSIGFILEKVIVAAGYQGNRNIRIFRQFYGYCFHSNPEGLLI